jgi:hypothetical protein
MKFAGFYPVLMDVFGFTSGIVIYYLWLSKKQYLFYMALFVSLFVFPTTSIILLAYVGSQFLRNTENHSSLYKYRPYILTFVILSATALVILFYIYLVPKYEITSNIIQFSPSLYWLSAAVFLASVFLIFFKIVNLASVVSISFKEWKNAVIPIIILLISMFVSKLLSLHFKGGEILSPLSFFRNIIAQALSFPGKNLISNFIYYGLPVIIYILFYNKFFQNLEKSEPFLKIIVVVFLLFSFGTEPRQFLQLYPFAIFVLIDSIKEVRINKKLLALSVVFQLIWSRFWYPINIKNGFLGEINPPKDFSQFPAQRYFQFQGPWLSLESTIIYGILFIFSIINRIISWYNSFCHFIP